MIPDRPGWWWYKSFVLGPMFAAYWTYLYPQPLMILWGLVLFTLLEYATHRWLLHDLLWSEHHKRHHTHPEEYTMFPPWYIPVIMLGFFLVLPGAAFAGFLWGFSWFVWWHHILHHWPRWKLPLWVQAYAAWHDVHHYKRGWNYGITHPFWDLAFGTYRRPDKSSPAWSSTHDRP